MLETPVLGYYRYVRFPRIYGSKCLVQCLQILKSLLRRTFAWV